MQNSIKVLAAALALGVSGGVFAAPSTTGELSDSLSGDSVQVTVEVDEAVKLTLDSTADLDFGTYNTAGDDVATPNPTVGICIYHRGVVTAGLLFESSNANGGGEFNMIGDGVGTPLLEYSVATASLGDVTEGDKEENVVADSAASDCGSVGAKNDTVTVTITGDLDAVSTGTYTDTLTMTVSPT